MFEDPLCSLIHQTHPYEQTYNSKTVLKSPSDQITKIKNLTNIKNKEDDNTVIFTIIFKVQEISKGN